MTTFLESYSAAVTARRWDEVREQYAPDIRVNDAPSEPDSIIARLIELTTAFPDLAWEVRHLAFDGDLVLARLRVTGTHEGTFAGIAPTGRQVVVQEFAHYRVVDGRITELWVGLDMHSLLTQLAQGIGARADQGTGHSPH